MTVLAPSEPLDGDARDQSELVRRGEVSPSELRDAYERRSEGINPRLNAVVASLPPAAPVDRDAPFAGVPMLVKDLIAQVSGSRQSEGSRMLAANYAVEDSPLVTRYRAAGFSLVGKTNTSEFGHKPVTEGELFGPTANPWRLDRNAGGSSGGSAAAVAAGLVAIAHGNDAGGSIRIPASCCGVFGFKPSLGAMPTELARGPFTRRFVSEHVITRTVRDSAAVFAATALRTGDDRLEPGFERQEPPRLRIGLCLEAPVDVAVGDAQVAAAEGAARLCEELGHEVEPVTWPVDGERLAAAWFGLWADAIGWQVCEAARLAGGDPHPDGFDSSTWSLYRRSLQRTPIDSFDDLAELERAAAAMEGALATVDVWLSPTLAQSPPRLAPELDGSPRGYLEFSPFTRLANIAGQPSFSAPLHADREGMPVGALLTAGRGRDTLLLRLACQLEQTSCWRKAPPSSALHANQKETKGSW